MKGNLPEHSRRINSARISTISPLFFQGKFYSHAYVNPLPPSDAVRKQKKIVLENLFSSVLSQIKKYYPSENLKFNRLGIFQSLKLGNLMGKTLRISLKLNFTPNTLGCYGLIQGRLERTETNVIHFKWGSVSIVTSSNLLL